MRPCLYFLAAGIEHKTERLNIIKAKLMVQSRPSYEGFLPACRSLGRYLIRSSN